MVRRVERLVDYMRWLARQILVILELSAAGLQLFGRLRIQMWRVLFRTAAMCVVGPCAWAPRIVFDALWFGLIFTWWLSLSGGVGTVFGVVGNRPRFHM